MAAEELYYDAHSTAEYYGYTITADTTLSELTIMASSDVDQKFLGRLAKYAAASNPLLSASLYQVLGLSVLLSRKLFRARKLRKLDTSRDTKSLALYHHILWLSREGLTILEMDVLPFTHDGQLGPEGRVLSAKLRASFYHVFCLFHNQPPLSSLNAQISTSNTTAAGNATTPLSPRRGNGQTRKNGNSTGNHSSPKAYQSRQKENTTKQPHLREPIASITSETSFLTNPYATPPPYATSTTCPPGLSAPAQPANSSAFLLPPLNFVPLSLTHFTTASGLSSTLLPGSHPLRLSVALEHAAFLWDVARDRAGARRLARRAIRDVYRAQEGMDDSEFEDAAQLVGLLGGIMRRGSLESTPKAGTAGFGAGVSREEAEEVTPEKDKDGKEGAKAAERQDKGGVEKERKAGTSASPLRMPQQMRMQTDPLSSGGPVGGALPKRPSSGDVVGVAGNGSRGEAVQRGGTAVMSPRLNDMTMANDQTAENKQWGSTSSTTPKAVQHTLRRSPEMRVRERGGFEL